MTKLSLLLCATALSTTCQMAVAATESQDNIKLMNSNGDSMISHDEYMAYYEQKFSTMKQTNGMVSLPDMKAHLSTMPNRSSMNNKPLGTTTDSKDVNPRDATNGKSY
jgi:predicted esterase YcpF (UPF0227 family)